MSIHKRHLSYFKNHFEYLYHAEYLSPQIKAELSQAAVADDLICGNISDYQPSSSTSRTEGPKNTYQ
ncbi:MAG: hypothetical protein E6L04_06685 [Thaumarchaeota archaeon]|nr:MAG: hypothetical protein E6L04_06685 [Nitrososphaerota archaeon]TLX86964.1 MAG: hypothetical protein E6K97_09935 [Nitrososphaerota archaeon]